MKREGATEELHSRTRLHLSTLKNSIAAHSLKSQLGNRTSPPANKSKKELGLKMWNPTFPFPCEYMRLFWNVGDFFPPVLTLTLTSDVCRGIYNRDRTSTATTAVQPSWGAVYPHGDFLQFRERLADEKQPRLFADISRPTLYTRSSVLCQYRVTSTSSCRMGLCS